MSATAPEMAFRGVRTSWLTSQGEEPRLGVARLLLHPERLLLGGGHVTEDALDVPLRGPVNDDKQRGDEDHRASDGGRRSIGVGWPRADRTHEEREERHAKREEEDRHERHAHRP